MPLSKYMSFKQKPFYAIESGKRKPYKRKTCRIKLDENRFVPLYFGSYPQFTSDCLVYSRYEVSAFILYILFNRSEATLSACIIKLAEHSSIEVIVVFGR